MKEITKEQKLLMDKCEKCGKEITGYTEKQVNFRMKMHKFTKHK